MNKAGLLIILGVLSLTFTTVSTADDWGCKCILCLSNPGGATEFSECVPPIERLWRHLHWGGDFPNCDMGSNSGVSVEQGYEKWEPCKKGYALTVFDKPCGEQTTCGKIRMCRRQTGVKKVAVYDGESIRRTGYKNVPVFDQYKQKKRIEPFWVQVNNNGQKGAKYYYSRSR